MIASRSLAGLALFGVLLTAGCIFSPDKDPPKPTILYPKDLSHPDSLLQQLQACYVRKEIQFYAPLLGREFKFLFQENDITPEIPLGYWNFEEDSTGTRALFESPDVLSIRIELIWDAPQEVTLEGKTVQRVFVSRTNLDVDQSDGVTLRVDGDKQYFYFRRGVAEDGEDPSRWYIVQWEDLGAGGEGVGAPKRVEPAAADEPIAGRRIEHVTWSELRERLARR